MWQLFGLTYGSSNPTMMSSGHNNGLLAVLLIPTLVLIVIVVAAMWRIFQKAGRPGWAAIVPIYGNWVLFEISGKPGWWSLVALLSFIPFVGWIPYFVLYVLAMLGLAKRFGKSTTFAVLGMIIFSVIGLLMLGYGKAEYHAPSIGSDDQGTPTPPPIPGPPAPVPPAPPGAGLPPVA